MLVLAGIVVVAERVFSVLAPARRLPPSRFPDFSFASIAEFLWLLEENTQPGDLVPGRKVGGAGSLQRLPISSLPFQVGRKPGMSLCLPVPHVSKLHAEIFERGGILWVRDMGSTNGTYVNGNRVDRETRLDATAT